MTNLLILVKMQLKEQFNFKRLSLKGVSWFKIILSILAEVLKFAAVTALCYFVLLAAATLHLFSISNIVPTSVISLVFSIMLGLSIFSCTVGLTKSLYLSRDNSVLLTLPCLPIQVYLSKLIIFFIFELKRNFSFLVPLFIAYFILNGYGAVAYLWFLVCIVLISLFTVAIGALLSIPGMYIANFFRQRKLLQFITLGAFVALAVFALFFAISLIPDPAKGGINLVRDWSIVRLKINGFLEAYTANFTPLYDLARMMLGDTEMNVTQFHAGLTLLRFGILFVATAAFFGIGFLCVRPLFYKMASKPFEHLKRSVRPGKNRVLPPWLSSIWSELLTAIKSPDRLFFNAAMLISTPMLVFLLNKMFLAMNTNEHGEYMILAFNVLIILLLVLNANTYASSIYSRDGRSSYLIKTQPTRYFVLLVAKLVPTTLFVGASLIVTCAVLYSTLKISAGAITLLILSILAIYLAHLFYCAELDLMNPKYQLYASMGASENNPNEIKATVSAFLISFLMTAIVFLLSFLNEMSFVPFISDNKTAMFFKIFVVALAALAWRAFLFFQNIKLYYKEK